MSFEGFEIEEEDETDEEADQVRPLKPLRITVNNVQYSTSPDSAPLKSSSSIETTIQTPTSAVSTYGHSGMSESGSSPEYHMANGDSPPRQGPVSTGSVLDRKGSKWRKSVMGGASDVSSVNSTALMSVRGFAKTNHSNAVLIKRRLLGQTAPSR
jgi:hypothetical protein